MQLSKHGVKALCECDPAEVATSFSKDVNTVLQVIEWKPQEQESKKKIAGKMTLSDGVSTILAMIPLKVFNKILDSGATLEVNSIVSFNMGSQQLQLVQGQPILIFKSDVEVVKQNVQKVIGAPLKYAQNKKTDQFADDIDLRVPEDTVLNISGHNLSQHRADCAPKVVEAVAPKEVVVVEEKVVVPVKEKVEEVEEKIFELPVPTKQERFVKNVVRGENYMPIKHLNSFSKDWKIKARVTKKAPLRTWNNSKGTGKLLNIDLVDREGTGIQATFFNDAADKFNNMIEQGQCYLFANGFVKMANKRFTSIKNDFCLTFDNRTEIEPVNEDDNAIQAQSFSFVKIREVESLSSYATVDVVGVIVQLGACASINLKDGSTRDKRAITIADETEHSIDVTVWGELASSTDFRQGAVIAFKGCRVSEFSGRSLNASSDRADTVFKVNDPEVRKINEWCESHENFEERCRNLSERMDRRENNPEKKQDDSFCSIAEMVAWAQDDEQIMSGKSAFYRIEGCATWIPGVIEGTKQAYYLACTKCKKKVTEEQGGYNCVNCDQIYKDANPSYVFSAKICDYSDSTFISFMGDTGSSLLGVTAREFHNDIIKQGDTARLESVIQDSYFKPCALVVRAKRESFQGGQDSIRYFVQKVLQPAPQKQNVALLERLAIYKNM